MPAADIVRSGMHGVKVLLFWLLSLAVCLLVPKGRRQAILVLKIDALGDMFVWFSSGIANVADDCRRRNAPSVILVRKGLEDFYRGLKLFDEVWPIVPDAFRRNIPYRLKTLCRLRRYGFETVLQMRTSKDFLQEDLIVRTVGAKDRRSPIGDRHNIAAWEAAISDRWYTQAVCIPAHAHELERNRQTTAALVGGTPRRYELNTADVTLPDGLARRYFVVATGAGWEPRKWPLRNFLDIAKRVRGLQCVITGTKQDADDGQVLAAGTGGINLCGRLDLFALSSVIRKAAFVLCNESGSAHMAAYLGTPSVAVVGGGHYGWFLPYPNNWPCVVAPVCVIKPMACFGCNWHCRYDAAEVGDAVSCIARVEIDAVWQAVKSVTE